MSLVNNIFSVCVGACGGGRGRVGFCAQVRVSAVSAVSVVLVLSTLLGVAPIVSGGPLWEHTVDLSDEFRLMWTVQEQDVTFEVQALTLGYVGVGFSRDGRLHGADMAIGWVDQGQAYFQDRHTRPDGDGELLVDTSQDYNLLSGYENATHTVLRFRRKLDTCDEPNDLAITDDTMRVVYMYHEDEPRRGSVVPGSLPSPHDAYRGWRPLYITQRVAQDPIRMDNKMRVLELRNQDVELPSYYDTMQWCKMFKLTDFNRKHHLIRYEPVFDSPETEPYLTQMILYECHGNSNKLEQLSREQGQHCEMVGMHELSCTATVATWARGSQGFTFPPEAGYSLDSNQARFYMMKTHYDNTEALLLKPQLKVDNSGLRLFYTQSLRKHDAGVLSIGIEPNWRHIIPPGHANVVSEGHCVEECTQQAFPPQGISIFAVMMQANLIATKIRLRQIRDNAEMPPIAHDNNIDPEYQEYRRLATAVRSMPGDRLIAECTYDSSSRSVITLGGLSPREEQCLVHVLYYPKRNELTACQSLPDLPTVLNSLGIEKLVIASNPVTIAEPPELAGMTLETRLTSYDWSSNFDSFQKVMLGGSFKTMCWTAKNELIWGTEFLGGVSPNLTHIWKPTSKCNGSRSTSTTTTTTSAISNKRLPTGANGDGVDSEPNSTITIIEDDHESNNLIEGAARSKVSRSSATETMGLSSAPHQSTVSTRWLSCASFAATTILSVALSCRRYV